jgi:D-alanyl-D-alanine carboxypeptidase/D-alanyl-D-alanine-endopeptidase (penicillin-binding protein 4)
MAASQLRNFLYKSLSLLAFCLMHFCFGKELYAVDHAIISIYAVHCDTGKIYMDKNSDLSLMPASCLKIVTTAAALHLLGPEYRFETHLEYDGCIDSNTLYGTIYIRGGGDPCLGSDRTSSSLSWEKQIENWADAIQKKGIQRIKGEIRGDASSWEKALAVPSWAWEDIGNYYGAGASALSFHENSYSLFFKPTRIGERAYIVRTEPPLPSLILHNEVCTGPEGSGDRACIYGSECSPVHYVRGTIPAGVHEFVIKGALPDPGACCADLLTQELRERGIEIDTIEVMGLNKRVGLHTTYSPTIREIVYWTNQKSINLYAEHLLKKIGEVVYKEGSTVAGTRAITHFLANQNIDLNGLNIVDGSGLSRKNLITTKQLVHLLVTMKHSECFPIFFDSLPQKHALIRAKSGTLSSVKGYAGYVGNIAFAILINNCVDHQLMNERMDLLFTELTELHNSQI